MVDDELRDGSRIGELLSSEVHGHERGALGRLSVVDADKDAVPTDEGTFAYAVAYEPPGCADGPGEPAGADAAGVGDTHRIAEVYLHPDRIRVEFAAAPEPAVAAAESEPAVETTPPGTAAGATESEGVRVASDDGDARIDHGGALSLVVGDGAAVKPALRVVRAVAEALDEEVGEP